MEITCYSERILNPFRGVMNIIALEDAEAVTLDGIHWSLYVHDQSVSADDDPEIFAEIDNPDIRFGSWSREHGFIRAPILPCYHYLEIQHKGERMLEVLRHYADETPFAFRDRFELWLLDGQTRQPLALLDSASSARGMDSPGIPAWRVGNICRRSFTPSVDAHAPGTSPADALERMVNQRAGTRPSAQWFVRSNNGYGIGAQGVNTGSGLVGRELSPRMFPRLFIEEQWADARRSTLVHAFIEWLSPWLLLMDFLKDDQRACLERSAVRNAVVVDRLFRLYPRIINERCIRAARVEAMLRKAGDDTAHDATQGNDYGMLGWRTA